MPDRQLREMPSSAQVGDIEAILEEGPADLPTELRRRTVAADSMKIKVPHLNGYEHFERVPKPGDTTSAVFRWTTRTRIAE
ncbi:DUF5988 family protein [Solwaraspora sp. WMMD1047]|uniref:DUF5988 family protein n=1 Tax=Solwaraspora sp. WMMD1047 TaxID=3016102 RepID=UPI00241706F9|nr:DUF5988 family protein [Solwaraspora sp. WMMD1047]MDG4830606.1 DUF5988 family protein [Solwaraspora sp. WMMD1047]